MPREESREPIAQADLPAGAIVLEKYELIERLAVGGMASVWRARNRLLDSEVAVKVMFPTSRDLNDIALQRAHAEARLAAQLQHPAVCCTLDFGISDAGHPVVVTELLRGQSFDQILREQGPLPATRAVQLVLPLLDGLTAAHAEGIVHRDVKPANFFLAHASDGSEQPKLLDFGIARGVSDKRRVTVAGVICGTPDYMSPEQARGNRDVDSRSDLWSVCASLYELVTDRLPFEADNYNAVMFAVSSRPHAPITELAPLDAGLVAIIERGLNKDRELRFQSARQLARELAMYLLSRGVEVDACGHSLRSRWSSPEIPLTDVAQPGTGQRLRRDQRAPTLRRVGRPRVAIRSWGLVSLAAVSMLGLGAWTSRSAKQPRTSTEQQAPAPSTTLEPILIEGRVPSAAERAEAASPALVKHATLRPASRAAGATMVSSATPHARQREQPRAEAKTNALGYDFGL